jgi:hypothetical protein
LMNNGERKGGDPDLRSSTGPGLQDFWQIHRSAAGGADHNSPSSSSPTSMRSTTALHQDVGALGRRLLHDQRAQRLQNLSRATVMGCALRRRIILPLP